MSIFAATGSRRKIAAVLAFLLMFQMVLSGSASFGGRAHAADKPQKYITFLYTDFKEAIDRMSFNGWATAADNGALQLTPNKGSTFGTAFNREKVSLRDNTGFSTYFTFNMTNKGSDPGVPAGADGLVFAIQTKSNSAGSVGGGMGFEGIPNSVGVEFDTFDNGPSKWGANGDPSDNHVAVDLNGYVGHGRGGNPAAYAEPTIDFNSGSDVYVWIDYKTADQTLYVYYSSSSTRPTTPKLTYSGLDLASVLASKDVFVGFTAATGSAWQNHNIKQWYFTNTYDPIDLNSATYVEAPSIMSVNAAVYDSGSVQTAVYYKADLNLKDSKKNPGKKIDLYVENVNNTTFLDPENEFAPLSAPPTLKTDDNGNATYFYTAVNAAQAIPTFRISTLYGAYYDIRLTTPPQVETGTPEELYNANDSNGQRANIPVNIVNTGGTSISEWAAEYREKTDNDSKPWIHVVGTYPSAVLNASGTYTVRLEGLKEDTYYEARAFAKNNKDKTLGQPVQFVVQMPMPKDGLKYSRVGPSKIYYEDAESVQVVGENLYWLLKKLPYTLSVKISGGGQTYTIPRSDIQTVGNSGLKIKLPTPNGAKLPLGVYDLNITHEFFDSKTFTSAFELTKDTAYRSINYDEIVVDNTMERSLRNPSDVDNITLRGPFVENASEKGVFRLRDPNAVVTLNDNLLFKGTDLVVDKSNPVRQVIRGKGRLYVNGKNTIPILSTYTILDGNFELDPTNFKFGISSLASKALDYTGMNMPVDLVSFTFIKGGIRISGKADLGFKMGSAKINAGADVTALDFMKNRFDLAANFKAGADFKSGPLEAAELRFSIDTRTPEFGVGASAELKKAKVGFDIDLLLKDKKLDSISFAVKKEIKIGSTGAQITKLGGGVSNMTALSEAPLTFSVLGGLSDYLTPKIGGNYMVNGNDLRVDLSANHFGASGKLAIYSINIAGVDMFIVFNPTGYRGYDRAGFDLGANINVLDILVGQVVVKYFQGSSFTGYASAAVQVPRSVPLVGGQRLSKAEVGVDSSRFRAALSVIGIGFVVKYPFSTRSFDWDVDMASTLKNIGSAVVNTGKAVVNKIKSWFWFVDPNAASESTAADFGDVPGVVGEKLFSQSSIRASILGTYVNGRISTEVTETNPIVTKAADGKITHEFTANESYDALIAVKGAGEDLKLISPDGSKYGIRLEKKDGIAPNAYYDAEKGVLVIEAALTKGVWKIVANATLDIKVHKLLYAGGTGAIDELATDLNGAVAKNLVPLDIVRQGKYLVEIVGGAANAALIKGDGRAYSTEANAADAAWNVKRDDADGTTWMLIEAPGAERWYVNAGMDAKVNLYRMRADATMSETMAWRGGSEFAAAANFTALKGFQATLDIYGGTQDTKLYRPDGTSYPLVFDKNSNDWNAIYDETHGVVSTLIDVDQDGIWIVKSGGFVDLDAMTLMQKSTMADMYGPDAVYTYSLSMMEKGKYLLDIAGGDLSTKIYGTDGREIAINATPDAVGRNAILDENGLKVSVDISMTGTLKVQTKGHTTVEQYLLAPLPQVAKLTASAQAERNAYEVTWRVENAKPDTKVKLIMANDANEPVGQVLAENLPASGITTVTLPANNLPGDYYLALVADSESYAPVFKTLEQPIAYQASQMLAKPANIQAQATGDAGVTISFTDAGYASTTAYRVYPADANGNVNYNGTSYEFQPDQGRGANQRFVLAGLTTEQAYKLRVMIVRAAYEADGETLKSLLVSELSDVAEVFLPKPNPAKLDVSYEAGDRAPSEQPYYPYEVKAEDLNGLSEAEKQALQHTLVVTDSDHVVLHVDSDQPAKLKLLVNDAEVAPKSGDPAAFELDTLTEGEYRIEVQATNAGGDTSSRYSRLIVDRTAPYLYLKTPTNGAIVDGSRARLEGATEAGAVLTVNGTVVPVDAIGHFVYYAPFPDSGVLPLELKATDAAGNETVHKLEVLASGANAAGESSADLAAFGTGEGVLDAVFIPSLTSYKTSIDVREKQTRVWAVPVNKEATVTIGGKPVDDQFSAVVDMTNGSAVQAVVKSGGNTQTYSLNVTTESGLAGLKSLDVSAQDAGGATVSEAIELSKDYGAPFAENTVSYAAQTDNAVASVRVKPVEAAPGSLIRVTSELAKDQYKIESVTSGQSSGPIALKVGSNKITVEVLSPNDAAAATPDWKNAKKFELKIERKTASDASLKQLALSGIALMPGTFDSSVLDYNARVGANTSSAQLSFAATDANSAVFINGAAKGSAGTETLTLATGTNSYVLEVHAADGTVQTYSLVIYRDKTFSSSLLLSELSVKDMKLTTEFKPLTRNYQIKDSTYSETIVVVAKPEVTGAIVKVNGKETKEDGTAMASLSVGINSVQVQVQSPDTQETNLYSISIVRNAISVEPTDEFTVKINDDLNHKVATGKKTKENGKNVLRVSFVKEELNKMLASSGAKPVIKISADAGIDRVVTGLTAELVKNLQQKEAVLYIDTGSSYYMLPSAALDIAQIQNTFAPGNLSDVAVTIDIKHPGADEQEAIGKRAAKSGAAVIGTPTDFSVTYTYNGKTIAADRFSQYVERAIELPAADAGQVTTGVRILEDGSLYHVPTFVKKVGERDFAVMNSFTNSVYALIANKASFKDTTGRWSQQAVEDLASRTILTGTGDGVFEPARSVTRAEFAAMIVRALGLPAMTDGVYKDVKTADWYAPFVSAAKSYGLISGYPDGTFRPKQTITRAEAVAIIGKAWTLAGKTAATEDEAAAALAGISDSADIPAWVRPAFGSAFKLGLISGYGDGGVKPLRTVTREETAAMLRNLLVRSELIESK
ncbi:cadherin-like beta sandwich domain-containing protein [Cohnella sp. 56]|uniref:cadherin-like beta sandwich domain-containing protein n=1 Tax=Cohnella sp. 56 TaxID=3113722 RepID=UPI0030E74D49